MLLLPKFKQKVKYKSIAVLTSGGDAPGMNAAIRAVVRFGISSGCRVFGIYRGYQGLLERDIKPMNLRSVANIIQRGGTVLKTSRCKEFHRVSYRKKAAQILRDFGIEGLVAIGGDGTFAGAHALHKETKFPVVGVPGTIDNDVYGSDDTIGFDTAINTAIEAIDRIRDTASSHSRLFLIEVMGRNTGFIAAQTGIGGGAETIIIPNRKESFAKVCRTIESGMTRGKSSSIIVVAEGPKAGEANRLHDALKKKGYAPRACILGHIQRGGTPTAHDRFLASTLGAASVKSLLAGHKNTMIGVSNDEVVAVPFSKVVGKKRTIPTEIIELAQTLAK